jgi:hypothetical protein
MEMAIDTVCRRGFVNIRKRNFDRFFLARLNHFLHLHRINGEPVLDRECIDHLERERPGTMRREINRPATPLHFRAVLLNRYELGILLQALDWQIGTDYRSKSENNHQSLPRPQ